METFKYKIVSLVLRPHMNEAITIRERIVDHSLSMFLQYGTKSVSMDDIARDLGISKKTIYAEFSNKDELVYEVVKDFLQKKKASKTIECTGTTNAIEESICAFNSMRSLQEKLKGPILYDIQKFHPKAHDLLKWFRDNVFIHDIKKNLQRGIEEGVYREDIDAEIVSQLHYEALILAHNTEFWKKTNKTFLDIKLQIRQMLMLGIVTPKGAKLLNRLLAKSQDSNQNQYE